MGIFPGTLREHVPDLQTQQDVAVDGPPFEQVVMLQHISNIGGALPERLSVQLHLPVLGIDQAAYNWKQSGFAAPRRSYDGNKLPGGYGEWDICQCFCFSFQTVICIIDIFKFQYGFHADTPIKRYIILYDKKVERCIGKGGPAGPPCTLPVFSFQYSRSSITLPVFPFLHYP